VFRAAIEQAGLHLQVDCPPLPELIYVDREMWEKIVLNLLSNAFKFTFAGEIAVRLRACDAHIELEVRDTGTGIPIEELPHIFERFHRVKGARGRSYEGSGIGLSLVQELARLHDGTIEVSSILNQGTCFTVSIPAGCAHLPSESINRTRTLTSTATGAMPYVEEILRWLPNSTESSEAITSELSISAPVQLRQPSSLTARILLADDNADMRDYLKRLLSQQYEVEAVANGVVALAAIRQRFPDLVLADVMMPGLDGFGLLRELRANPQTQELPTILLSARAGEEARIAGLAAGADDYLTKPFSARELLARVEANLKLAQLRREATQREQGLRLEAETAKQEAEAAYEHINQILECMTDAFVAFDRNWCYTYANPAALQLLQKSPDELIGKNVWKEVFPSEVGGLAYRELHRAREEQVAVSWEQFGEPIQRWLEIRAYPSTGGIAVYFQDISDRKQSETALRENEDRLRLALESAELGTWDFNPVTGELKWDEGCKAMFGLPSDAEVTWELTASGIHPDDRDRVLAATEAALNPATQDAYAVEYRTVGITDGIERWVAARGQAYFNSAGEAVRFIGTVLNITEQKQAEAEREQLLAREQAAREAAEAASRIKDEFLAIVSHELRSPLNPILGWSKLLRTRRLDEQKTDQALEVIERNAQMQAQLINDLLDVSRILRGKLSLDTRPVDLASTIQAALETVRLAAEAKSIQIHTQLEPHVGQVAGDAGRLQQVVWNLLTNAVKFTSAGGQVEVKLSLVNGHSSFAEASEQRTKDKGQRTKYAQITIRDTGKGINPEFLPHVFDQFRQESSATTRRFGGLGLGLAIVRYLVELHGGTVQANSPGEGQGATFTVKLPLMPHQPGTNQHTKPSEPSLNLQGMRILVVDDDDNTREFLAFLLELHQANVIAVATAGEALTTLAQFQPDVLLSDIGMPNVDGYMLMRQIRALSPEQGGTIPAIALTAYAGEIDYQQAMAAGFQVHIAKPIEPQVLIRAIAELRENRNG
jgi:PAS domain S-box-containing protein